MNNLFINEFWVVFIGVMIGVFIANTINGLTNNLPYRIGYKIGRKINGLNFFLPKKIYLHDGIVQKPISQMTPKEIDELLDKLI